MWQTSPCSLTFEKDEIYTLSFALYPDLVDELTAYQNTLGIDDEVISAIINDAVMSTNLPLTTRAVLEHWTFELGVTSRPLLEKTNVALVRKLQTNIFNNVIKMSSDRMLAPQKYGYVILTMDVERLTLISFPRYRYLDVVDLVARLTRDPRKLSIRGWKNRQLPRFAFVESLHATMFGYTTS